MMYKCFLNKLKNIHTFYLVKDIATKALLTSSKDMYIYVCMYSTLFITPNMCSVQSKKRLLGKNIENLSSM